MDEAKVAGIRRAAPSVEGGAYLNTGTCGPMPRAAHEAVLQAAEATFREGRIGPDWYPQLFKVQASLRDACGRLLGCSPQEIALTHCTTEGLNIAIWGLDWQSGDELLTARTEHPAALVPAHLLAQRFGVRPVLTDIGLPGVDSLAELERHLTSKTRMVVLSHVTWSTGMVLPIREMAELAHQAGALLVVDAAQSVGMVPTDVKALGVDALALPGQKWLCGPVGMGALYVDERRLADLQLSHVSGHGMHKRKDGDGYDTAEGAERYEAASLNLPAVAGLNASLAWLEGEVGWGWAHARIARLGQFCWDRLAAIRGVSMITPKDQMAGLTHFKVSGAEPPDISAALRAEGVGVRHTPWPAAIRVSTGFYNTEADIEQMAAAVERIAAAPEQVRGAAEAAAAK